VQSIPHRHPKKKENKHIHDHLTLGWLPRFGAPTVRPASMTRSNSCANASVSQGNGFIEKAFAPDFKKDCSRSFADRPQTPFARSALVVSVPSSCLFADAMY
jgi:hypothetical protein